MIVLQKSVPEIYYSQSRDFQFLARTLEVLVNYIKTNADEMRAFPLSRNLDVKLLTLLAYTLGFASKHNYNSDDLYSLCASFSEILKVKGSLRAIRLAVRVLLNAQQIDKEARVVIDKDDLTNILIYLPIETTDIVLLEDLFDYILPCGFTYSFIYGEFASERTGVKLKTDDKVRVIEFASTKSLGRIAKDSSEAFNYDDTQSTDNLAQVSSGVIVKGESEE